MISPLYHKKVVCFH